MRAGFHARPTWRWLDSAVSFFWLTDQRLASVDCNDSALGIGWNVKRRFSIISFHGLSLPAKWGRRRAFLLWVSPAYMRTTKRSVQFRVLFLQSRCLYVYEKPLPCLAGILVRFKGSGFTNMRNSIHVEFVSEQKKTPIGTVTSSQSVSKKMKSIYTECLRGSLQRSRQIMRLSRWKMSKKGKCGLVFAVAHRKMFIVT